jgi:enediyne biosynthesis protein E4
MRIWGSDPFKLEEGISQFNLPRRCLLHLLRRRHLAEVLLERPRPLIFVLFLTLAATPSRSQQPQPPTNTSSPAPTRQSSAPSSAGGMATAGAQKAEFDSQHRPITAGGFVKEGPIIFQNVAAMAGLTSWHHKAGTPEKRLILEAKGPGVCLIDYDNDGWLDIYLVNGSTYDALAGKAESPHAALFHNNHDGTFTNVTAKAGVANDRWGYGCAVGDYDNDGWPDLYVTNFGKNRLYHNNHDGTFTDMAESAGVSVGTWSAGATFGDYDGDGRLDLFVDGYLKLDLANPRYSGSKAVGFGFCQYRGEQVMCGPRGLVGEQDHLFHNNGNGTFTDVSKKLGVDDPAGYYGLGALFADVNGDGKMDLLVADDSTPNYLYINKGNGTFEDASYASGYALNSDGREVANMGIAAGDYENNGHLSIVNTTFADDYNVLFQNDGSGFFTDVSYQAGIAVSSIPFVSFADGFLDYDNDGWKDLLIINGHVYPEVDRHPEWGSSYAQRPLLYHNIKKGKFELVPAVEGTGLAEVSVGRGAAFGDIFNDGKIDVIINSMDGTPVLLRNVNPDHHRWVDLKLIGGPKSPRDAVGTTVYLNAAGIRQRSDVLSGGSYLSSNDMRVHFGLGDADNAGIAEIHWPSGARETVKLPAVDRIYTVSEGHGITDTLNPDSH